MDDAPLTWLSLVTLVELATVASLARRRNKKSVNDGRSFGRRRFLAPVLRSRFL